MIEGGYSVDVGRQCLLFLIGVAAILRGRPGHFATRYRLPGNFAYAASHPARRKTKMQLVRGFVSYSHEDKAVCEVLARSLAAICGAFQIEEFWIDDSSATGRCFRKGYEEAIERASIHVLLLSRSYLWSKEIMARELPLINAKQRRDRDLLLPLVVEHCLWESVIGSILASPRDRNLALKPLNEWKPIGRGIGAVEREFMTAIEAHFGLSPKQRFEWNA